MQNNPIVNSPSAMRERAEIVQRSIQMSENPDPNQKIVPDNVMALLHAHLEVAEKNQLSNTKLKKKAKTPKNNGSGNTQPKQAQKRKTSNSSKTSNKKRKNAIETVPELFDLSSFPLTGVKNVTSEKRKGQGDVGGEDDDDDDGEFEEADDEEEAGGRRMSTQRKNINNVQENGSRGGGGDHEEGMEEEQEETLYSDDSETGHKQRGKKKKGSEKNQKIGYRRGEVLGRIEARKKKMDWTGEITVKFEKESFNARSATIYRKSLELGELTDKHFCITFVSKKDFENPANGIKTYFSCQKEVFLNCIAKSHRASTVIDNDQHEFVTGFGAKVPTTEFPFYGEPYPAEDDPSRMMQGHNIVNYNTIRK
jgi:hypothetical protein